VSGTGCYVLTLDLSNGRTDKRGEQQGCDGDQVTVCFQEVSWIEIDGNQRPAENRCLKAAIPPNMEMPAFHMHLAPAVPERMTADDGAQLASRSLKSTEARERMNGGEAGTSQARTLS
jgi:hypothetical protein